MTAMEIGGLIGAALAGIGAVIVTVRRLGNGHSKPDCPANPKEGFRLLLEAIKEQTALIREVKDKLVGIGYEHNQAVMAVGRVETSLQAVHRRLDGIAGSRE